MDSGDSQRFNHSARVLLTFSNDSVFPKWRGQIRRTGSDLGNRGHEYENRLLN